MATTNNNIKISTLAKELKMKSGKELIEKLKELGFDDIKSPSGNITPDAFNKLFESIRPSYTEDGIEVEDYLKGNAVIAEFKKKEEPKAAPAPKTEPAPKSAPAPKTEPAPKAESKPAAPKTEEKKAPAQERPAVQEPAAEKPEESDRDKWRGWGCG